MRSLCRVFLISMTLVIAVPVVPLGAQSNVLDEFIRNAGPKPQPGETNIQPGSPNPYLALMPEHAKPDWLYWRARAAEIARGRAAVDPANRGALPTVKYEEAEPADVTGLNDTLATGEFIRKLGTDNGEKPRASIEGFAGTPPAISDIGPFAEDDGSIPLASETGLAFGEAVTTSGVIGDGLFGSAGTDSGDFDFYAVRSLVAGQTVVVDVDTPLPFGDLDPFVVLWSSAGAMVALNDDDGATFDSLLSATIPADGDYFVSIAGFGSFFPTDPFVSSSGAGAGSEGDYEVRIEVTALSTDVFTMDLKPGDVIGATAVGGLGVALLAPDGSLLIGSGQDASFLYPAGSRLPGGGPTLAQVATEEGRYGISVTSSVNYNLDIRVLRPGLSEVPSRQQQILFIDFDGEVVDTSIFGPVPNQPRTLSPLVDFLLGWGLSAADENMVIDAILATLEENLSDDFRVLGLNGDRDATGNPTEFDVEIRNSRDHADPFGEPNVSRLIVGGTIAESEINTIGIAQSIDPGNFGRGETALILLDILSAPAGSFGGSLFVLNNITLDPSATIIDLIGVAVGNIVAHEAGHYLGSYHTDQFNPVEELMDQGGNPASTFGLGPDLIFGSAADVDVDFGLDIYVPNEGFVGLEDALNTGAFALSTGRRGGR